MRQSRNLHISNFLLLNLFVGVVELLNQAMVDIGRLLCLHALHDCFFVHVAADLILGGLLVVERAVGGLQPYYLF